MKNSTRMNLVILTFINWSIALFVNETYNYISAIILVISLIYLLINVKELNILAVIRSKIKNMDCATKYDYFFLRPCGMLFLILLILKITTIITASWWVVFIPIIIPILVIWWELSKNAG